MKIKVILLEDINKLGNKLDIKEVKLGYAKNYLIPSQLVTPITKEALNWRNNLILREEEKRKKEQEKLQNLKEELKNLELEIPVKVGEKGELFEKITPGKIAKELKEKGLDIKKDQVKLKTSIQERGKHSVKIQLSPDLEQKINIEIKPQ